MSDSSQNWEPGAHCTACRQLNRLESGSNPYVGRLSASSRLLVWSQNSWQLFPVSPCSLVLLTLAGRQLINLVSFRNFLKLFTFLPKELPYRMEYFSLRGNCYIRLHPLLPNLQSFCLCVVISEPWRG